MCRVVGYLGRPISLDSILFATDSSLARQTYSPRMMATFLNLAGFGMAAWDEQSARPDEPFLYKVTSLPVFDRNLKCIAEKVTAKCVIAHVRGVTYSDQEVVSQTNLHPFRFSGVPATFAHNGHLREFARMRYDLVRHVHPETGDAAIQPEAQDPLKFFMDRAVVPVEIRLGGVEEVQVPLARGAVRLGDPGPG
jgi:glutamine amidotransferase